MPEYDKSPAGASEEKDAPEVDEELQDLISDAIESAVDFVDNTLSPDRARATDYYLGKPFGNEEEGRSQVVLTEVRDAVDGVMPGMLRVFFAPDHTVEFEPVSAEDVEEAEQKTDYARYVFERDNDGFMIVHATLKDGFIRKVGAVKWGWEETAAEKPGKVRGVTLAQFAELEGDDEVEIKSAKQAGSDETGAPLYDIEYVRRGDGRVWVEAMRPEELLFTEPTRKLDGSSGFVGHRTYKTRQELLDMGIPKKAVEEYGKPDDVLRDSIEEESRRAALGLDASTPAEEDLGEDNDEIRYVEGYLRVEGVLRQICTIGPENHIVKNTPVEHVQMAAWCPNPEPHTLAGLSLADSTMDMQLIKSSLFRSSLDSLALSIYNRMAYQEGQVAVEDVLNTEIGAPIRTVAPPANVLQNISHDWKGRDALSALEYCDATVEKRIGRDQGSMGLDADALQSSTKQAVGAVVTASQERQELTARLYAEMLLKPLFKGIVRELVAHQPRKRVIRLRNKWVEMDPRSWNVDMDAVVRVALGSSLKEEKLAVLTEVKMTQESILRLLGPENPMVKLWQYHHTLKTGLEIAGLKDTHNFFTEVPKDWSPPPQQPKLSPEEMLMQLEQQKLQIEMQKLQLSSQQNAQEFELKQAELQQKYILENAKLEAEVQLKLRELEIKYATDTNESQIDAEIDLVKEQARLESESLREAARLEQQERQHAQDIELKRETAALNAEVKRETAKAQRKDKGKAK